MNLSWLRDSVNRTWAKRLASLIPIAVYLCGIMFFITDTFSIYDFPLDDAWIHRVYSRSFAYGHGFEYNDGSQEAGLTSPLWAVVTCPAHWLEIFGTRYVVIAVKLIGVLLGITVVQAINKIASHITGSRITAVIAASLFALEPRFLFSSLSGMESNLLIALWTSASAALLAGKCLPAMVLFSLTPVTRPEAVVILPLSIVVLFFIVRRSRNTAEKFSWIILFIPILLWLGFCKLSTGHWLPNTFYLKATPFHLGTKELHVAWQALSQHGLASLPIFLPGVVAYVLWCLKPKNTNAKLSLLLVVVAPVAYLFGVVGTRSIVLDGYYWTRWIDPASLMLTVTFCLGYAIILSGIVDQSVILSGRYFLQVKYRAAVVLITAAGFTGVILTTEFFIETFNDRRSHLANDSRAINIINVQTGKWINKHTPQNSTVGVNDAGAIRYFGKRRTVDLIGLNNSDITFGKLPRYLALAGVDWLAVFPFFLNSTVSPSYINKHFNLRVVYKIPVEEYTVCNCPKQTTKIILERKLPANQFR